MTKAPASPSSLRDRRLIDIAGSAIGRLVSRAADYPRPIRQLLAFAMDLILCVFAVWLSWSLRMGSWYLIGEGQVQFTLVTLVLWTAIAWLRQTYSSLIRYAGGRTMAGLAVSVALLIPPLFVIFVVYSVPGIPRTMVLLHPIVFLMMLAVSRMSLRFVLTEALKLNALDAPPRRLAIYGAGPAAKQLALLLRHEPRIRLIAFIDDDDGLAGAQIDGVEVISRDRIERLIERRRVEEVLLAVPEAGRSRRRDIIQDLSEYPVQVRTLPDFNKVIDGTVTLSDLREVEVEELLGRDPVPPRPELLAATITGKCVLVSGAGGSIGSELVRQIARLAPRKLVLVEMSEFALYSIERELMQGKFGFEVCVELANVAEEALARRMMARHRPDTVFHAAAYKHVPLVEDNPLAAIHNNVFGTRNLALTAQEFAASHFILISTDKAVRPTNVMGATKRVCELILQGLAERERGTVFSMVRFGNVLGSSGSVVPLFKQQIAAGGPVTLTHRDVTRYFMTIPEAALLVIQAGAMARGGEVFVLDMGESVRIYDLAVTMIRLSGLTVRNAADPDGDIEIREVGLRPGEKLYEELLIGDSPSATTHPRILQAREDFIPFEDLENMLSRLSVAVRGGDGEAGRDILRQLVPDFVPTTADASVVAVAAE